MSVWQMSQSRVSSCRDGTHVSCFNVASMHVAMLSLSWRGPKVVTHLWRSSSYREDRRKYQMPNCKDEAHLTSSDHVLVHHVALTILACPEMGP